MITAATADLGSIRIDLASPDAEVRGRAMDLLLRAMRARPDLRPAARELFRAAIDRETDTWAATSAIRGLEELDGPDAVRPAWRSLLTRPDPVFARRLVLALADASHVPMLMQLLDARTELPFRTSAIRMLGRLRDPAAIPTLLRYGEVYELQPAVVQALDELGDPSVIPWVERFVTDDRPLPELDERGASWTLGDIAGMAVRSLGRRDLTRLPSPARGPTLRAAPPALPRQTRPAPRPTAPSWARRLPPWLPLVAVVLQIVWLVGLFAGYLFLVGDTKPPELPVTLVDVLAMFPSLLGILTGLIVMTMNAAPRWWEKLIVLLGCLACGGFVYVFGRELLGHV